MTVTLTKPKTQVVWRSTTPGTKTTSIPGSDMTNDGYSLDIKTTLGNGDTHNIVPTSGTIGGLPGITFTDNNCNLFLRSKGRDNDWIIRCLCCYTPTPFVPPPVFHDFVAFTGNVASDTVTTVTAPGPSGTTTFTDPGFLIKGWSPFFLGDNIPQTRLVAHVYTECMPPPAMLTLAPTVSTVTDDQGLTWTFRSGFDALLDGGPGPQGQNGGGAGRNQWCRLEQWMADSSGLVDGTSVNITATLNSVSFVPQINVHGFYHAGIHDPSSSFPAHQTSGAGNILPSFPVQTTSTQCAIFIAYVTPHPFFNLVVGLQSGRLFRNPVFTSFFAQTGFMGNFNQDAISGVVDTNSCGVLVGTGGVSFGLQNLGANTRIQFPTTNAALPIWASLGPNHLVQTTTVIVDASRTHVFIGNQTGNTGMSEPTWNTASVGDNTIDGTAVWTYLGPSFYVAPFYVRVPRWDEPFIGKGHTVTHGDVFVTDPTFGFYFRQDGPGDAVTGLTEPVWDLTGGSQTNDGTAIWTNIGPNPFPPGQEMQYLVVMDAIDHI